MLIPTFMKDDEGKMRTVFDEDAMRVDLGFGEDFRFMIHRTVYSDGDDGLGLAMPPFTISEYDTGRKICTDGTGTDCVKEAKRLIQEKGVERMKEVIGALLENDVPLNDPGKYTEYEDYDAYIQKMREYGVESSWI